jgi:cytochrome c oxidase subunit III
MSAASPSVGAKKGSPNFHVAHHFDSADTQFDAGRMGIWLFLVTEILFFGGLFCAFFIFRSRYFDSFVEAHNHLDWRLGALNTVFLITSSLTMALGVRSAQTSNKDLTTKMLFVTFLLAGAFLVVKYFEYTHKIHDGLLPGNLFFPGEVLADPAAEHARRLDILHAKGFTSHHPHVFFSIYFVMTGIHGLHVVIGMGLILWILFRNMRGEFSGRYYAAVEGTGLYWHLVDLIWIYLFPLLYLVG